MLTVTPALKIVLWVSCCVLSVDLLLAGYILYRRGIRWLYFRGKDAAGKRFGAPIRSFVAGELAADELLRSLRAMHSVAGRDAVKDLLLENLQGVGRRPVTEILFQLGYVEGWARRAFGRRRAAELIRFIVAHKELSESHRRRFAGIRRLRLFCIGRAIAVSQLGQLDSAFSKVFMREALIDPSPYVVRAYVAAMGRNREAEDVSVLLDLLREAAKGSAELPVTSVKSTLVRSRVSDLDQFVPFLNDEDPRFRFVLVDSIRQVCDEAKFGLNAGDFPDGLYQWFVNKAPRDASIDVRARSAGVIRHFHDTAATETLCRLMGDKSEFVRMHAVRACADPYYFDLIPDVIWGITDTSWRVREASVKTLGKFGRSGRINLAQYFLDTEDQFACEQIIEGMQRNGIITEMLPALSGEDAESMLAMRVCFKMVRMGKTSLLVDLLKKEILLSRWAPPATTGGSTIAAAEKARAQLLELLLRAPTEDLMIALQTVAERKGDHLRAAAQAALESLQPAAFAGEESQCTISL